MSRKYLLTALLALAVLGACGSNSPKEDVGTVAGAILGGALGHQIGRGSGNTAATIGGAALGAFLGNRVGRSMDREDQRKTAGALERSPDDRSTTWRNPNTGQIYSITPPRTYRGDSGPCREFTTTNEMDGRAEVVHGTACRQPDGSWRAL
jgi:surface antigen